MNPRRPGALRRAGRGTVVTGRPACGTSGPATREPAGSALGAGSTAPERRPAPAHRAVRAGGATPARSRAVAGPVGRPGCTTHDGSGRACRTAPLPDPAPAAPGKPDPKEVGTWSSGT
ncbi:hypothetical protein Amsp01_067680 [Amycolatopsis sp. NBRC 101858]|nr:hypothetical protein Amsp01_067680 [Amycolatopsis sp. NBRC 101858]